MNTPAESKSASFPRRAAAFLLDLLIVFIPCVLFSLLVSFLTARVLEKAVISAIEVCVEIFISLVPVFYGAIFESSKLQATPGKLLFKIKVVDLEGNRVSFLRALARNLAFGVSDLTFGIGYLWALFSKRKQCVHDMIANCLVISSLVEL